MKRFGKIVKYTARVLGILVIFTVTAVALILEPNVKISGFATLDEQKLRVQTGAAVVLDDEGHDIAGEFHSKNRYRTPLTAVPMHTRDAFVAVEDKRFYSHGGVDYVRVLSSAKNNLLSRSYREGASTITQQLIKNTHLSPDKTIRRKVQEIRIARALERKLGKDEILELYLNRLYFGHNLYGIDAAAKAMFYKRTTELTVAESALLAAVVNNPSKFNPYTNPQNALSRRNLVLLRMKSLGKISDAEYMNTVAQSLGVRPLDRAEHYFLSAALTEASVKLGCKKADLYQKNLTVETFLDRKVQTIAEDALADVRIPEGCLAQVMVLDNLTGGVLAYTGAGAAAGLSTLRRSPGSTVKPILCFAPAIEKRLAVPVTPILDERTCFGGYSPTNYLGVYEGWTSLEKALTESSNVCAVRLTEQCGIAYCKAFGAAAGYDFTARDRGLALALGGMENGLTLLQIANSYRVFANGGMYSEAIFTKNVYKTMENGQKNAFSANYKSPAPRRVMNDSTAYLINSMLATCAKEGTARRLQNCAPNICGKTGTVGTAAGNTDAYCIGYNQSYTVAVWIGAESARCPHQINGGGTPAAVMRGVFLELYRGIDNPLAPLGGLQNSAFIRPESVKTVELDALELDKNHRLVLADESLLPRYKKTAEVPKDHYIPKNFHPVF